MSEAGVEDGRAEGAANRRIEGPPHLWKVLRYGPSPSSVPTQDERTVRLHSDRRKELPFRTWIPWLLPSPRIGI